MNFMSLLVNFEIIWDTNGSSVEVYVIVGSAVGFEGYKRVGKLVVFIVPTDGESVPGVVILVGGTGRLSVCVDVAMETSVVETAAFSFFSSLSAFFWAEFK